MFVKSLWRLLIQTERWRLLIFSSLVRSLKKQFFCINQGILIAIINRTLKWIKKKSYFLIKRTTPCYGAIGESNRFPSGCRILPPTTGLGFGSFRHGSRVLGPNDCGHTFSQLPRPLPHIKRAPSIWWKSNRKMGRTACAILYERTRPCSPPVMVVRKHL